MGAVSGGADGRVGALNRSGAGAAHRPLSASPRTVPAPHTLPDNSGRNSFEARCAGRPPSATGVSPSLSLSLSFSFALPLFLSLSLSLTLSLSPLLAFSQSARGKCRGPSAAELADFASNLLGIDISTVNPQP